jgi:serine/threonine protein kinase
VGAYEQAGLSVRATHPPFTFHTDQAETPHLKRDYGCAPERQYGRHGDINPGNILWYNDGKGDSGVLKGTLKIADFGQAELNSLKSRTKPRDVANTLTYRPPESDKLSNKQPLIRQTYDMWCLGCVFLEFVTWMLGGDELQEKFTSLRESEDFFQNFATTDTFFQVVRIAETSRLEVMVKEAVTHV